ncbi:hypothetical protein [Pseudomonas sp. NPDC089401]|uniref:hypothetical protein n=1 Tax=Pseudomonas sp. NPDC089401 TaxID=3364462 RepID=UPI0038269247
MKKHRLFMLSSGLLLCLQLPSVYAAKSLTVTVYAHDDLATLSDAQLNTDYFQHWLDEMRTFTQHPIEVIFRRKVPGITDIAYADMSSNRLLDQFTRELLLQDQRPFSFMNKNMLMTRNSYDRSGFNYNAGLAYLKQNTAIASLAAYSAPAHEIGHMLGATHEDAELKFNGWFCETYTHPRVPVRSNCYRYSDKNRTHIADYIKYNSK